MSTPIPSFQKLTISPIMQSTRGTTAGFAGGGHGRTKGKAIARDEDSSESEESSDEEVEDSFNDLFALDHCRQYGPRYAFQLAYAPVERYGIRIHPTGPSECSCNEINCRHYVWLLDEIARTYDESPISPPISPHEQIKSIGLKNICEELDWEMREGHEDRSETKWLLKKDYSVQSTRRQTRSVSRERMRTVRDIMATLSQLVPDDYRKDIFNDLEELPQDPIVIRDLESTMILLLIKNDDIFYQFKGLVPRNIRASEFFRKMAIKSQDICFSLDYYCEHGSTTGQQQHDVIWCAQSLVDIVRLISTNIIERQPLSSESRGEAAAALVSILRMVVKDHNFDAYQNNNIPRRRPHGEQSVDRNLYEKLIGSGESPKNPSGGNFILDVLQDLPEARQCIEDLEEVHRLLLTIGWGPAPRDYTNKLERIITQLKGETGPSPSAEVVAGPSTSSSVPKRYGGSMDRKAKRMK